jgi:hypothetical protein
MKWAKLLAWLLLLLLIIFPRATKHTEMNLTKIPKRKRRIEKKINKNKSAQCLDQQT